MSAATYSGPAAAELAGVTYRQADYWCRRGVLGPAQQQAGGSGVPRQLTTEHVAVLAACGRVSELMAALTGGLRLGSTALYRDVAEQVQAGARVVRIRPTPHGELTVDVSDLCPDVDRHSEGATP